MPNYVVLISLLLISSAQAETAPVGADKVAKVSGMPDAPVGAAELANITLALFFVLALIFVLAWLFRRYGNIATLNKSNIQVLGGVSLGHRERAVLLEVEGERILVGVAQGNVSKLHVLEKKDSSEIDEFISEPDEPVSSDKSFSEKLKQVIAPKNGDQP